MTETELIRVCDVGSDNILWDSFTSLDTESSVGIGIGEGRGFNKCRFNKCRENISGRRRSGQNVRRSGASWVGWMG